VQDPLAELLLAGTLADGTSVPIDADASGLIMGENLPRRAPKGALLN
jgi:hypothetical protein